MNSQSWQTLSRFLEIKSPWLTLIGEKLQDHQNQILDYWRVEKADSVIVIPIQNHWVFLPVPVYRPGIGKTTLDFPGGRLPQGISPEAGAIAILQKELNIQPEDIAKLTTINSKPWYINSSFSNQKLYGFVAQLKLEVGIEASYIGARYPLTPKG